MLFKQTLFVSAALAFGCVYAQDIDLATPESWSNPAVIKSVEDGILEISGRRGLYSKEIFKIDPAKTYKITGEIRQTEGEPSITHIGFIPLDENKKHLTALNFNIRPNTDTEIVADCKADDTVMMVKDASKWGKVLIHERVALNTKEDYSDLPNKDYINVKIEEIKKDGDAWMVIFSAPIKKEVTAGTKIRLHRGAGYIYTGGSNRTTSGEDWKKIDGSITGHGKYGFSNYKAWPPGTAYARFVVLANYNKGEATLQMKNFKIEVVD